MVNKLTVLGSGTCISSLYKPFDYRNPSGHLLQVSGKNILLDCADGIRRKMDEMKFDYYNLDAIFISHFHPDHFSIDAFIQSLYVRAKKTQKRKLLSLYGPPTIKKRFIDIWNKKNIPSYEATFPGVLDITYYEYANRQPMKVDNLLLIPYKVLHGGMDAYALRLEFDNKVFVYSGDCTSCEEIIDAAKEANLFLCEAGTNIGEDARGNIHLSPFQAGEIARKANAEKLVLVHYTGKDSKEDMEKEVRRAGFEKDIAIAEDLDSYSLFNTV